MADILTHASLATSLEAYYELNESSGTRIDRTANARNLTDTNSNVSGVSGALNNAASIGTAANNWLRNTSGHGIDGGAMSMSIWFKARTDITAGAWYIISQTNNGTKTRYFPYYEYNGGTRRLGFHRDKVNVGAQTSDYTVTLGTTWHHIVLAYDGTNMRGYIDGSLVAGPTAMSGSGSGTATTGLAIADNMYDVDTTNADFDIDEVGIWSKSLSSTEVTDLYNSGSPLPYSELATVNSAFFNFM